MNNSHLPFATIIPIAEVGRGKRKVRAAPKGRAVDAKAVAEVRALLGDAPRRRDLLIEFLHRIQDTYGSLSPSHLVALAQELKLAMTEVYEVATFYHHFDVVKEGEQAPPRITVRVCETLSCAIAGGERLLETATRTFGPDVRVLPAPCIGRCEHAPAAVVGRHTIDEANVEKLSATLAANVTEADVESYVDYASYRAAGGYRLLRECVDGMRNVDDVIATLE